MARTTKLSVRSIDPARCEVYVTGIIGDGVMILQMSETAFNTCLNKWDNGSYIQDAFSMLSKVQREFLMTGASVEQQTKIFSEPCDA
jgi:hypothetical protein